MGFGDIPATAEPRPERPKRLFHASPNREIEELLPHAKSVRDPDEGPQVFATPDMALAAIALVRSRLPKQYGKFGDVPYAVFRDKEAFLKEDKGGAIYELPPDGFGCRSDMGLGEGEWTCPVSVKPIGKIEIPSALDAMLENGVQVYFVDAETMERLDGDADHGLRRLRAMRSENQERGLNVRELPSEEGA